MNKKYEIEINYIHFVDDAMIIGWSAKNIGFGVLSIYKDLEEEKYHVETETMGKEFYKQVLKEANKYLLENSIIVE